jgi:two-component system, LytTR family, sensor kinase
VLTISKSVRRFALLFVLWTTVACLFTTQWYAYDSVHGRPDRYLVYVRWNIEQWYAWLVLSPFILRLATKRPIDLRYPWRAFPLHLVASVLVAFFALLVQSVISHFLEPAPSSFFGSVPFLLTKDVAMGIITYWALTVLAQTLHFYKENSERQVRESQLEQQLAKAQLQVLQMQLHPHFLFNTLHAIGTLIREDPDSAEQMLLDLSSLLRTFLEQEASQQISLRRELHLVDLYLGIQRIRFKDRLTISMDIAPSTLDCAVPSLILQPLVENAIVHGIAKNPGSDEIRIMSEQRDGRMIVEIRNSNSILTADVSPGGQGWGVGLLNTKQRLAQLYNGSAQLSIEPQRPRGFVCSIAMPMKPAGTITSAEEAFLFL